MHSVLCSNTVSKFQEPFACENGQGPSPQSLNFVCSSQESVEGVSLEQQSAGARGGAGERGGGRGHLRGKVLSINQQGTKNRAFRLQGWCVLLVFHCPPPVVLPSKGLRAEVSPLHIPFAKKLTSHTYESRTVFFGASPKVLFTTPG